MQGETISHYEILSELGRGGMGVVYRARDTKLGREVAIKLLPPHLSADPEAVKRFVHEARAASALNHSAIGVIHEIDETEDGQTFIVMALYEGGTLRERLDRGPMTAGEAVAVASQIASGLVAAHEKGIVHRDIKPQNILLTKDGEAKIIDFGLAKLAGRTRLTRDRSTLGTAAYMSPEQARGEEVDHRSDIFSLGAVLYEMLASEPPFRGEHEAAMLYGIVHEEPEALSEKCGDVPEELCEAVEKALKKDPAERYQQAEELRSSLRQLTGDTGRISAASGSPARPQGKSSRKRIFTFAGLAAAAAIVLFLAYLFIPRDQAHADRRSIAVMPFKNIVTEPGYEWLADGMRERITGHLTKIEDLKVISNDSVDKFRDTGLTNKEIAGKLGFATILEASVQQTGGRMLLMFKLVDARTDDYIWAEDYDRDLEDVQAVQTDVALNVVEQLKATLSPEVEKRIKARPTDNFEAYKLLMRGQEQWSKQTYEDRLRALATYEEAIRVDPDFADAYSKLADGYLLITLYGYMSPKEMIPKAKEYISKALELDKDNLSAYETSALLKGHFEWDLKESEKMWKRVIELNPGYAGGYAGLGWTHMLMKRFDEAIAEHRRGLELNPESVAYQQNLGEILYYARRYDESIEASLRAIEMDPDYAQSRMFIGAAYHGKGMDREAVAELDKEQEMSGGERPEVENWIGSIYAMVGEEDKARAVLEHLHEMSRDRWVSSFVIATIHMALGEVDPGFQWLEKAYEEMDTRLVFLMLHPAYDGVRTDPRYIDILNRTGLADSLAGGVSTDKS
jgi:serine/threonine-protein kinase